MIIGLLTLLIVLDVALLLSVFLMSRKQENHASLLRDLTEERRMISDIRGSVQEELRLAQSKSREMMDRVTHIAAEAEKEVKSGGQALASNMEEIFNLLTQRFEKPLTELSRRQIAIESLMKRVEAEKGRIVKAVNRGERLIKFFDEKTPYNDVLKEIESRKYDDCRALLSQGVPPESIARELGLSKSEVDLISHLA
jgi:hypothetical protein